MTTQETRRFVKLILGLTAAALTICTVCRTLRHAEASYTQELANLRQNRCEGTQRFHRCDKKGLIAHGGGLGEFLYTNSTEAIADSLYRNFRFIEIDFQETPDHHLIGAHDWQHFHSITGHAGERTPLTLAKAEERKIYQKFHPATARDLREFMRSHKDFILVTDKINNYELLMREIPYPEQMIVEVFSPQDYLRALKVGIPFAAFNVPNKAALKLAQQHLFPIITISADLFLNNAETMQRMGICIMVYGTEGIDLQAFVNKHLGNTASMIYTSEISPASQH